MCFFFREGGGILDKMTKLRSSRSLPACAICIFRSLFRSGARCSKRATINGRSGDPMIEHIEDGQVGPPSLKRKRRALGGCDRRALAHHNRVPPLCTADIRPCNCWKWTIMCGRHYIYFRHIFVMHCVAAQRNSTGAQMPVMLSSTIAVHHLSSLRCRPALLSLVVTGVRAGVYTIFGFDHRKDPAQQYSGL